MEQTPMIVGCAIALIPIGLVVGYLQVRLTLPPDQAAPLWREALARAAINL